MYVYSNMGRSVVDQVLFTVENVYFHYLPVFQCVPQVFSCSDYCAVEFSIYLRFDGDILDSDINVSSETHGTNRREHKIVITINRNQKKHVYFLSFCLIQMSGFMLDKINL